MSSTTISARTGITSSCFSQSYFTDRYENEWGDAINFDGPDSGPVREFFLANAGYWIDEYHLDGLRLDATQQIFDASDDNIMAAIVRRVREAAGEPHDLYRRRERAAARPPGAAAGARRLRARRAVERRFPPQRDGRADRQARGLLHRLPRRAAASSSPPPNTASSIRASITSGRSKRRGTPALDLPAETLVVFLQNHDQVANSAAGLRVHALTSPGRWRAMTALSAADAGHSDAVSGPGIRRLDARSSISPTIATGSGRGRCARAARDFLAQFPSIADPGDAAPPGRPGRRGDLPPLLCSICPSASATRRPMRCIATCSRCAATIRSGTPAGAGRRRGDRRACLDAAVFRRRCRQDAAGSDRC